MHLDMDSFFVAVERLKNPRLNGRPVVVGGTGKRAVVASASYEARKFGVRSAQAMVQARRLCRDLIVVPPSFSDYSSASKKIFAGLRKFSPVIEQVSIDEAYLDLTGCERLYVSREDSGRIAKKIVLESTGLTATVGIATNKLLAKVASSHAKPDGLLVIAAGHEEKFLAPLPIETIPGVGSKTAARLHAQGIRTCQDIALKTKPWLKDHFGSFALELQELARGSDERAVSEEGERKSIGEEETFEDDIGDIETLSEILRGMSENIAMALRSEELLARTVQIKIRYGDFSTFTRAKTLADATDFSRELAECAQGLLREHKINGASLRLLGMSVRNLEPVTARVEQLDLFSSPEAREKEAKLEKVKDLLKKKFGSEILVKPRGKTVR